ncbi:ATP-binding protein [Streptomyces sp. NPDC101455]|uniref:ATP-binding protein n=1 Tax=Streptomyces sp. NPDC101455 TaxID=3366142 RepID=UPI00380F901E
MSVNVAIICSATSCAAAHESVHDFLAGLDHPITPEDADTVILVVSELVTHALCHGSGACTLELTVHANSPQLPHMPTPDPNGGTGGFGRPMVNRLASTNAVTRRACGSEALSVRFAW